MNPQGELAGPPLLAGLLEGPCFTMEGQPCYNQGWALGKAGTDNTPPTPHDGASRTTRNYFQFSSLPYVQTQLSGVVCSFSLNDFPGFLLCKNNSNFISVVSPSTFSFCFHSRLFLTQPRKMSRCSYGLWSMWKRLMHYSLPALFLLIKTEIKVQNKIFRWI